MGFFIYDLSFLILFSLVVGIFLYINRSNLKREGIMFLYRTKLGIRAIKYVGDNFQRPLHLLKYPIIIIGYGLMVTIFYLIIESLRIYIVFPQITDVIKAPPLAPLIPYFPKIFGMQEYFPPFYFTYFIVALIVVAIVHEYSHGIYMRLFRIRIKSTGFAFLGPILGAFVEQDDKIMDRKKNSEQMTVLAAGVFANILFALIFFLLMVAFFKLSFVASGFTFNSYGLNIIDKNNVSSIENISDLLTVKTIDNKTYFLDGQLSSQFKLATNQMLVYENSPAFKQQLNGTIIQADNTKIRNQYDLGILLLTKKPGDNLSLVTLVDDKEIYWNLTLEKNPQNLSMAYLGIGYLEKTSGKGPVKILTSYFMDFKDPSTYYKSTWNGDWVVFIYNLLWWLTIINLFVALFNMLPLGILDGGKFFYLTVLSVTKSKKIAEQSFTFITYIILGIFLLLMLFWFVRII